MSNLGLIKIQIDVGDMIKKKTKARLIDIDLVENHVKLKIVYYFSLFK